MSDRKFRELLETQWSCGNSVCVGLDPDVRKIPASHILYSKYMGTNLLIRTFNKSIVDSTKDLVCAYKLNSAFYEAYGDAGWIALRNTIAYIHKVAPDVLVIFDAKRADIGNTNLGYVNAAFDFLKADAATVNPYFGAEALQLFLAREEKGIIVLCHTSNPGAGEFQDLFTLTQNPRKKPADMSAEKWLEILCEDPMQLYERIAFNVAAKWNKNGNCALVVGATYPEELQKVRGIVGDNMLILIPGIGAQGGDVEKAVSAGKNSHGQGIIFSSSQNIIFASKNKNFAEAARRETMELRNIINRILN